MKISELKLEECPNFETIIKEHKSYFGNHFPNVIHDFKVTHHAFLTTACGDPEIMVGQLKHAQQALMNYFLYYCFGVANTVDPKSQFNTQYDNIKAETLMKNIEKMAEETDEIGQS